MSGFTRNIRFSRSPMISKTGSGRVSDNNWAYHPFVCAVKVTAMMKMTDVMHLPGLRFLDLEQVVPRNFDDVAGPKNDATWSIEKPE